MPSKTTLLIMFSEEPAMGTIIEFWTTLNNRVSVFERCQTVFFGNNTAVADSDSVGIPSEIRQYLSVRPPYGGTTSFLASFYP